MIPSEDPFGTEKVASLSAQKVLGAGDFPRTSRSLSEVRRSVAIRNFFDSPTASMALSRHIASPTSRPHLR